MLRRALRPVPVVLLLSACNWLALARHAVTYDTLHGDAALNVVAGDSIAYVARADSGISIIDARTARELARAPVPEGLGSVDDLAIDGTLLFVLDARPPGHLAVLSLRDPLWPRAIGAASTVPVGPFSGVSANSGTCVISGGTSRLTAWRYHGDGALVGPVAEADLGRGQPDVTVSRSGAIAFVPTHAWGPYFELTVLALDARHERTVELARIPIAGAGFTEGGARPANFPFRVAELADGRLFVAHERGVAVISRSGNRWRMDSVVVTGGPAVDVTATDSEVAVAVGGERPAVIVFDVRGGGTRVAKRQVLPPGTIPTGIALSKGHVILATRSRVLAVAMEP